MAMISYVQPTLKPTQNILLIKIILGSLLVCGMSLVFTTTARATSTVITIDNTTASTSVATQVNFVVRKVDDIDSSPDTYIQLSDDDSGGEFFNGTIDGECNASSPDADGQFPLNQNQGICYRHATSGVYQISAQLLDEAGGNPIGEVATIEITVHPIPDVCTLTMVSDGLDLIVQKNQPAELVSIIQPGWLQEFPDTNAKWIWGNDPVADAVTDETYTFTKSFSWTGTTVASATLAVASAGIHTVTLGDFVASSSVDTYASVAEYDVADTIVDGTNVLKIEVVREGTEDTDGTNNPAGLMYQLIVVGEATAEDDCGAVIPIEPDPPTTYPITGHTYEEVEEELVPAGDWTIEVYQEDALFDSVETDHETGQFAFSVPAGNYEVQEVRREGWTQVKVDQNYSGTTTETESVACFFQVGEAEAYEDLASLEEAEYRCDFINTRMEEKEESMAQDTSRSISTRVRSRVTAPETPKGQVKGTSESVQKCEMFITDYMRMGEANNRQQVVNLQAFLMGYMGYDVALTGEFDTATHAAVREFQFAYQADILQPWLHTSNLTEISPTGYVYQLTRWKINNLMCPGSEPYPAELR